MILKRSKLLLRNCIFFSAFPTKAKLFPQFFIWVVPCLELYVEVVRSVLCFNLTQVSQPSTCNKSVDIPYTQLLMANLSTIIVKETRVLFQEFMRLTSNCFLHLAFDYCALRVIQVQAHHQTSFHLSCINNFFMVGKYAMDYWSTACFQMYLSSHHSYEEIKYTHSRFTD